MLSSWLANRMLDVEHRAVEAHHRARLRVVRAALLSLAEFAEDVRLWIDRYDDWRPLRRARRIHRDQASRRKQPKSYPYLEAGRV